MVINGTDGNDILGKDVLTVDTMTGKKGNDTYYVNATGDKVIESLDQGIDTIISSISYTLSNNVEKLTLTGTENLSGTGNILDNTIIGNSGNNNLYGGSGGSDTLKGMDGNDYLYGRTGSDKLEGGKGNDTYVIDTVTDGIKELANEGKDSVYSGVNYTLGANLENLVLKAGATNGTGNVLDNVITGNSANNNLYGGIGGNDTLYGMAGNDTLYGRDGGDTLAGGTGNDGYIVDSAKDTIVERPLEGIDRVYSSVDYTLGDNLENLILKTGAINGTGNGLNNVIQGNSDNNTLSGLAGNDTLDGKAGNDILLGGDGNDTLIGGEGADTLTGGLGKDTYNLAETTHVTDTIVVGLNTTFDLKDAIGGTDVANGFVLGEDKLDVEFSNIVPNVDTIMQGQPVTDGVDVGAFVGHTVKDGFYTLYDAGNKEITVTPENEKAAYGYIFENTPVNGSISGFHVHNSNGQVDTVILQHDHAGATNETLIENHIAIDLVGVNAASISQAGGADAVWIM